MGHSNSALLYDVFISSAWVGRIYSAAWTRVPVIEPGRCLLAMDLASDDGEKKVYMVHTLQEGS